MSDTQNQANAQNQEQSNQQIFDILRIYSKDCSLETPNVPQIFLKVGAAKPETSLDFNVETKEIGTDNYEVDLRLTVTCKLEEQVAFICEVHQAGVFLVKNFDEATKKYVLEAVGANILFPYAREHISSMTMRATFPPLNLNPINFEAIYRARMAEAQKQAEKAGNSAAE
jgi:preprotein translocase subunit SecB